MPDIDIDFDDEGRGRVMDYVIQNMEPVKWLKLLPMEPWRPNRLFEIRPEFWICLRRCRSHCEADSQHGQA